MPTIVSIVGKSKSGKTTLLEKLIRELKSRGYQVATIKHTHHDLAFNEPHKDSWRHIQAGSEATVLSAPNEIVLVKPVTQNPTVDEAAYLLGEDYDIILTEGFSQGNAPKIEVHRKEVGSLLRSATKRIAVVTDEAIETKARQFSLEDVKGLANFLEEGFIKPQRERVSLYVNDTPIPLTLFPKQIVPSVLLGLVSCLKGVGKVKNLRIFYGRQSENNHNLR